MDMNTEPGVSSNRESHLPEPVAEELRLLKVVQRALERNREQRLKESYADDLIRLRDSLADARLPEDRASIIEQMERISHIARQQARVVISRIDPRNPYFGHMRLMSDEGERRDILIGKNTFVSGGVRIVDWRNAPISKVFYSAREEDDYDIIIAGREVTGEVALRRTVTIMDRELERVASRNSTFVRTATGQWLDTSSSRPALEGGTGTAARPDRTRPVMGVAGSVPALDAARRERADKHLPEIASLLDPRQFELITSPDSGLVVIQGSAGSGKTTVALHRVAYLVFQDARRFNPKRTAVIVFNRALAGYISQVLPALGIEGVQVNTFEAWSRSMRRRLFPRLPDRISDSTPAIVSRLKQHPALITMLRESAEQAPRRKPFPLFEERFTDRRWLRGGFARHAPGAFSEAQIEEVHDWCTRMHFARVDPNPYREEPPSLDMEDETLLLYLYQLLVGPLPFKRGKPLRYKHLVVDEAQDFSPIELRVLLNTVSKGAPITLAGDTAQKIVENKHFVDWAHVLEVLELAHVKVEPLRVSYRSTRQIMTVAREVLGDLAPDEPVIAPREGAPVELFTFRGRGEAMTFLADVLQDLVDNEPLASIALLSRHPGQAKAAFHALERADIPGLRWVRDQDFAFAPGIEVTDISQAKGLEFDYVIVLDASQMSFREDDISRHLLHVAITRAAHQCWLLSVGSPTTLLPRALREAAIAP